MLKDQHHAGSLAHIHRGVKNTITSWGEIGMEEQADASPWVFYGR
jgi:hypothetical protein